MDDALLVTTIPTSSSADYYSYILDHRLLFLHPRARIQIDEDSDVTILSDT